MLFISNHITGAGAQSSSPTWGVGEKGSSRTHPHETQTDRQTARQAGRHRHESEVKAPKHGVHLPSRWHFIDLSLSFSAVEWGW
jgi:hypothetical protein